MNSYTHGTTAEMNLSEEKLMSGPGDRLKKTRESLGFTHADVAAHLNLRISIIEALEENNYSRIPKVVFIRGYLRSYAKLLKLPSDEIIRIFNKLEYSEVPSDVPATPISAGQKKAPKKEKALTHWAALILLIVLFAVVGLWKPITNFLTNFSTRSTETSTLKKDVVVPTTPQSKVFTSTSTEKDNAKSQESESALPDLDQYQQENN